MNRLHPKLIAITGGSGAGKSWLAARLQELLGADAQRVSLDSFYRDRSHLSPQRRTLINYDQPRCIDWPLVITALQQLKAGKVVQFPCYDFATHCRGSDGNLVAPTPVVLVEGLWLLRRPELRRLFDLSIFLDCPRALRLKRRLSRDTIERGRSEKSVRAQFRTAVAPMHDVYVEPQRAWADLVLSQPLKMEAVNRLLDSLWAVLSSDRIYPPGRRKALAQAARKRLLQEAL